MPSPNTPRVETIVLSDLVGELVADAEAAAAAKARGVPRGPQVGLEEIDRAIGSYLAPGVHLLQSPPGTGKTAFSLQMAANCGFPALFVSCEMPRLELVRRVVARTTNQFIGKFKDGSLSPEHVRRFAVKGLAAVPKLAIMDATRAYADPYDDILTAAEDLRGRFEAEHVLVVLDSLQVWSKGKGLDATEYERVNAHLLAIGRVASMLNAPVLAVSHMNRAGNKAQKGDTGGMHAGKGSGDLEYAAETVIELKKREKEGDEWRIDLTLHKNRHGESDLTIPCFFDGRVQSFREA